MTKQISIHAPRVGSDDDSCFAFQGFKQFQSTLPVWGATVLAACRNAPGSYFNPRSPCGERHGGTAK